MKEESCHSAHPSHQATACQRCQPTYEETVKQFLHFLHFLDFDNGQTEEDIICHCKKLDRQQADCPAFASEIKPASFAILRQFCNFTADSQFYWLKCKTHMTT